MTISDWARFFDAHAPRYMSNSFTRDTHAEVQFLIEHLTLQPGMHLLDVGCGTGRHSIELARRGLNVTGIDLSQGMLQQPRTAAQQAGVSCRFIQSDAAAYQPDRTYDAVICLCEGAFGLLGRHEDPITRDLDILRMIAAALIPGGQFMLTALNAARPIRAIGQPGNEAQFDLRTSVETAPLDAESPHEPVRITARERHYLPAELDLMCRIAGLKVDHIGGGTAGNWALRPLDPDEIELMLLAHRPH
jgi:SAM-dependent methyltransferase